MSSPRIDAEPTFVIQVQRAVTGSVGTARAVAHATLAAIYQHDCNKHFEELITQTKER